MSKCCRYIILFISLYYPEFLISQGNINFVPNPSFNEFIACPSTSLPCDQEFHNYYNWFPRLHFVYDTNGSVINVIDSGVVQFGSPDPFHSCNGNYFQNCTAQDFDGGGGVGVALKYVNSIYGREFAAVRLNKPLKPNQYYCCSFYISNCVYTSSWIDGDKYITDGQMMGFSSELFMWNSIDLNEYQTYLSVAVENTQLYIDTSSIWHKTSGLYKGNGNERYLFLGWAKAREDIQGVLVGDDPSTTYGATYVLFDSISVVECDELGMNIDNLEAPNVITPNGDGLNDYWILNEGNLLPPEVSITIFNRWGESVYQNGDYHNEWNGLSQDGEELAEGVYYYVILLPPNQQKAGFINIFR